MNCARGQLDHLIKIRGLRDIHEHQPFLTIEGTLRETVGVPTTVYSIRVRSKARWEPNMSALTELPFSYHRDMLLYRGAVTRPVFIAQIDMSHLDSDEVRL